MKKILIFANHESFIINFKLELIHELLISNNKVILVIPLGEKKQYFENMGITVINIDIDRRGKNLIRDYILYSKYKKIIKELKPDLLLTFTIKPNIYGGLAAQKYNLKYIPKITGLGSGLENGGILKALLIILYKKAMRKASVVFVENSTIGNFLQKKKIYKKPIVLPGSGVNLIKYPYVPYPKTDSENFVFIGRIMKEKGIDNFLDAALTIHGMYKDINFHVCGFMEENYEEKIQSYVDKGIIIYHGLVQDMNSIYKFANCIIHPSYHEGMSNVLLEGAATGRPLIASNIPGCYEIVEEGKNGFLVNVDNSSDLISKINKFIRMSSDEKEKMGLIGRTKVEKEFDRKYVINSYIDEIKTIIK